MGHVVVAMVAFGQVLAVEVEAEAGVEQKGCRADRVVGLQQP